MEEIQEKILNDKCLTHYNEEELKYVTTPIGKAIYKAKGRPKKEDKAHWSDKVICDVCKQTFTRSARSAHNKTKVHQVHVDMNSKLRNILINK